MERFKKIIGGILSLGLATSIIYLVTFIMETGYFDAAGLNTVFMQVDPNSIFESLTPILGISLIIIILFGFSNNMIDKEREKLRGPLGKIQRESLFLLAKVGVILILWIIIVVASCLISNIPIFTGLALFSVVVWAAIYIAFIGFFISVLFREDSLGLQSGVVWVRNFIKIAMNTIFVISFLIIANLIGVDKYDKNTKYESIFEGSRYDVVRIYHDEILLGGARYNGHIYEIIIPVRNSDIKMFKK